MGPERAAPAWQLSAGVHACRARQHSIQSQPTGAGFSNGAARTLRGTGGVLSRLSVTEMVGAGKAAAQIGLLGDLPRERAEGLERVDEHVLIALDPLEAATRENERLATDDRPMLVVDGGR